jgi:hypothetical protein
MRSQKMIDVDRAVFCRAETPAAWTHMMTKTMNISANGLAAAVSFFIAGVIFHNVLRGYCEISGAVRTSKCLHPGPGGRRDKQVVEGFDEADAYVAAPCAVSHAAISQLATDANAIFTWVSHPPHWALLGLLANHLLHALRAALFMRSGLLPNIPRCTCNQLSGLAAILGSTARSLVIVRAPPSPIAMSDTFCIGFSTKFGIIWDSHESAARYRQTRSPDLGTPMGGTCPASWLWWLHGQRYNRAIWAHKAFCQRGYVRQQTFGTHCYSDSWGLIHRHLTGHCGPSLTHRYALRVQRQNASTFLNKPFLFKPFLIKSFLFNPFVFKPFLFKPFKPFYYLPCRLQNGLYQQSAATNAFVGVAPLSKCRQIDLQMGNASIPRHQIIQQVICKFIANLQRV